ncbi:MAG: hypothetical protein ACFBRM_04405 [Pikeienuella sp.]
MTFEAAPRVIEGLNMTGTELVLTAVLTPLVIAVMLGFQRELAWLAASLGVIAVFSRAL